MRFGEDKTPFGVVSIFRGVGDRGCPVKRVAFSKLRRFGAR
jgi:hypothetical protein